jgi:hypothetical protein
MPTAPRLLLETLAGGAGTFAGGILGGIAGLVASGGCAVVEGDCEIAAAFALSGIAVGSAAGTYIAGRLMKGRGGLVGTLLGSVVGTGTGLLLAMGSGGDGTLGAIGLLSLPSLGAVAGYELSGLDGPSSFSVTVTHEGPTLVPVMGPTPHGGVMGGLSGRF